MSTAIDMLVSNADYHADTTVVSNTGKEDFRRSQTDYYRRYVSREVQPPLPTPALRIGIAAHEFVLEPDVAIDKYVCAPKCDKRTTAGKAAYAAFLESSEGKTVLELDEYDLVRAIQTACRQNKLVRNLLDRPGEVEHSYKWQDSATGLWLKSRPDKTFSEAFNGRDVIFDLKTCEDASPEGFQYACRTHGYHRTAAFRIDGHFVRTGNQAHYLFAAVSKRNLEVGLYDLQPEEIELGRKQNRSILRRMARCYETGIWEPDWSTRVNSLRYPAFMFNDQWEVSDGDGN